jgi:hypothetical protein
MKVDEEGCSAEVLVKWEKIGHRPAKGSVMNEMNHMEYQDLRRRSTRMAGRKNDRNGVELLV